METIRLEQPGVFRQMQTPPATPAAGEALVRVRRIGICGTDLHAYRGRQPFFTYPRILGHELGVEIVEAPPQAGLSAGDRCAVEPYMHCGRCVACRQGKTNCCAAMQVLGVHVDGGMREYLSVPVAKLHRSEHLHLDQLALVETLAIGAHAVQRAGVGPSDTVLVIGAGPIGLSVMQFAKLTGATVAAMDRDPGRLAFCREQLGIAHVLPAEPGSESRLQEVLGGDLPTVVLDATGNAASMQRALELAAHGGRVVYVGLFQGDVTFHDPLFHRKELTLLASRNALPADFKSIIGQMEAGSLDTRPWITHRAAFGEMIGVFPQWLEGASGVIKAMVEL